MRFEAELATYFERLRTAFLATASQHGGGHRVGYNIAGHEVAIHYASDSVSGFLCPALQHLTADIGGDPGLRVEVFETPVAEGLSVPMTLRAASNGGRAAVTTQPAYAHLGERYRVVWFRTLNHLEITLVDLQRGRAVVSLQHDGGQRDLRPAPAPLRSLLSLWFEHRGMTLVHAAAVGTAAGGVLIVGKSGCGKSTVALACLGTHLRVAGDDAVLVQPANDGGRAHSMYSSFSVTVDDVDRHAALRGLVAQRRLERPKLVFFLAERRQWLIPQLPLRAILIPRFAADSPSRIEAASPAEALLALAPSSVGLAGGSAADRLARLASFVRSTPSFTLHLGQPIADLPALIAALLPTVGASAGL